MCEPGWLGLNGHEWKVVVGVIALVVVLVWERLVPSCWKYWLKDKCRNIGTR